MLKYLLCVVLIVLIFLVAHQIILKKSNRENFSSGSIGTSVHPQSRHWIYESSKYCRRR